MQWIKSGIENPSKSEVIGRCDGDEKKRMTTQNRQKSNTKKKKETIATKLLVEIMSICLHLKHH